MHSAPFYRDRRVRNFRILVGNPHTMVGHSVDLNQYTTDTGFQNVSLSLRIILLIKKISERKRFVLEPPRIFCLFKIKIVSVCLMLDLLNISLRPLNG